MRRAIAYAIDRDDASSTPSCTTAPSLATGMLPTFHWAYDKDVDQLRLRSGASAKRLLDEAGYPDPDGDGPLPRFTIIYKTSSNKLRVAIANVIAVMLREVGIGVELRVYEFATFFADLKKGNFQMFADADPRDLPSPTCTSTSSTPTASRRATTSTPAATACAIATPEVDQLHHRRAAHARPRRAQAHLRADPEDPGARPAGRQLVARGQRGGACARTCGGFVILPTAQLSGLDKAYKRSSRGQ